MLWAPIAVLVTVKLGLLFVVAERQGLFSDWAGHAEYAPLFAFGFVLAGTPALWGPVARTVRPALAMALIAGIVVVSVETAYPAEAIPPHAIMAADRAARIAMAWSMTLILFHAAERWLNRDHRWRRPLVRAVFPAYILHHPAIVVTAWWTLPSEFGPVSEFAILAAAVAATCIAGYAIGRRVGLIGTLIGMPPQR